MVLETSTPIKELLKEEPRLAGILLKHGLDFCCQGGQSLQQQCEERGLMLDRVMDSIASQLEESHLDSISGWMPNGTEDTDTLIRSIIVDYHRVHIEEIEIIVPLLDKVVGVHSDTHPELTQIQAMVTGLIHELEIHMQKEEDVLFPYITLLGINLAKGLPKNPRATIQTMIDEIEGEHEDVGFVLDGLYQITQGYEVPEGGCQSYQLLFDKLQAFDHRIRRHAFVENEFLHPAAINIENSFR